jgi:hypothetical protein
MGQGVEPACPKTNLAVSSMEYCGCLFDERDIREALSGGCGHRVMIPSPLDMGADLFSFLRATVTEKTTVGVACIELGGCFIGIERESEYVKLPLDRWAKVSLQPALFKTN